MPDEATLSYQTGVLGRQLGGTIDSLTQRLSQVSELDTAIAQTRTAMDALGGGLRGGSSGLTDVSAAADDMRAGMDGVHRSVTTVSGYLDPRRDFVARTPDCAANPLCSTVDSVLQPVDVVTTAGIVFGLTMLALLGSSVASNAQIGTAIVVGLLIDTRSCGHSWCRPRWRSWAIGSSGPAAFLGAL